MAENKLSERQRYRRMWRTQVISLIVPIVYFIFFFSTNNEMFLYAGVALWTILGFYSWYQFGDDA